MWTGDTMIAKLIDFLTWAILVGFIAEMVAVVALVLSTV
jgi:hypothetical protein